MSKQKKGLDLRTLRRVLPYVKPYRAHVLVSLLCASVSAAAALLIPIFSGNRVVHSPAMVVQTSWSDLAGRKKKSFGQSFLMWMTAFVPRWRWPCRSFAAMKRFSRNLPLLKAWIGLQRWMLWVFGN